MESQIRHVPFPLKSIALDALKVTAFKGPCHLAEPCEQQAACPQICHANLDDRELRGGMLGWRPEALPHVQLS